MSPGLSGIIRSMYSVLVRVFPVILISPTMNCFAWVHAGTGPVARATAASIKKATGRTVHSIGRRILNHGTNEDIFLAIPPGFKWRDESVTLSHLEGERGYERRQQQQEGTGDRSFERDRACYRRGLPGGGRNGCIGRKEKGRPRRSGFPGSFRGGACYLRRSLRPERE